LFASDIIPHQVFRREKDESGDRKDQMSAGIESGIFGVAGSVTGPEWLRDPGVPKTIVPSYQSDYANKDFRFTEKREAVLSI